MAVDWVLGWLESMCIGGMIPPFCVELVLKDGTLLVWCHKSRIALKLRPRMSRAICNI
jgi:hypothetical protein